MEKHSSTDLFNALWSAADEMRATMSADVYKDYLLGLIFYKSLSDKTLYKVVDLLENSIPSSLEEAQSIYEECEKEGGEDWSDLCDELRTDFGCLILPKYTFISFYNQINTSDFRLENLKQAFREIELSQNSFYDGLFDDFDITSKDLGKNPQERNIMVASVIKALADINFTEYDDDALGDAYEYLISKFASESGKKAGEFYTPQPVAKLISKIVAYGREKKDGFSIYDPCCGSGSLLLQIKHFMYKGATDEEDYTRHIQFYGQELKNQTYNLARMNMMLHKVPAEQQHLNNGNTLGNDWPSEEPTNYDAIVMNPPYSQKWAPIDSLLTDPRFSRYEKLAPKSAADYAFLLHGFYHLKTDGVMGIVLPHGVLFRGAAEGVIRKHLIEDGSIYAVIGLPANIFFSTSIPTTVIILKKNNINRDILFIDASKDFKKEKTRNTLTDEHIEKIFNAYVERKDIEKYAHLASFEEIKENDFNLNIPRYVDTFEEEEEINIDECFKELAEIDKEEEALNKELNSYFKELGLSFMLGKGE
ncbi:MAG: type I restriction-modification system subunit M [Aeromonadales bacterium]|nr:type I restriction-modification system subunit M [Aeromonadales bacterium]